MPHVDTPQSRCRFGLARADITPPVGIYHRMWGAAKHDRSTGVHRPLMATVCAFAPRAETATGIRRQILVTVDHCLLWTAEMEALEEHVCRAAKIARDELVVTFSHTHAAGLMGRERAEFPGGDLIGPYLDHLAERVADLALQAIDGLEDATLVYGNGRSTLAANRDYHDREGGGFVCGFNPEGEADDTVLVARATNTQGRTLATFVNYACHPTTLAWGNTLISPDYPGAMREVVEAATGAPCVFLQGASGELGPREGFVGDTEVADRNGRELGYAALSALEALPPPATRFAYSGPVVSGATIGTWTHVPLDDATLARHSAWECRRVHVEIPYRDDLPTAEETATELDSLESDEAAARAEGDDARAADLRALAERRRRRLGRLRTLPPGERFAMPISLLRVGDACWFSVEGEHYSLLQRALRERFPKAALVVMTLAGGSRPSYLPTEETYGRGIYQEQVALLEPGCLEQVIEAAADAIADWFKPAGPT